MSKLALVSWLVGSALAAGGQQAAQIEPVEAPIVGDWDGDSITDVGLFVRDAEPHFLFCSFARGEAPCVKARVPGAFHGLSPSAFDWDGDGRDEPVLAAGPVQRLLLFDLAGDDLHLARVHPLHCGRRCRVLPGDFNGNGRVDLAVMQDESGSFWVLDDPFGSRKGASFFSFEDIQPTWLPFVGDWDGDGRDSIGYYDPAAAVVWMRDSLSSGPPERSLALVGRFPDTLIPLLGEQTQAGLMLWFYEPDRGFFFSYRVTLNPTHPSVAVIVPTDPDGAR